MNWRKERVLPLRLFGLEALGSPLHGLLLLYLAINFGLNVAFFSKSSCSLNFFSCSLFWIFSCFFCSYSCCF